MKQNRKLLIAGGLVAAVAASGGAFTAGFTATDSSDVAATGTVTVDGATVLDVDYGITAGSVETVTVTFDDVYDIDDPETIFELTLNGQSTTVQSETKTDSNASPESVEETVVVFAAAGGTPLEGVTSTNITVRSEQLPADTENVAV